MLRNIWRKENDAGLSPPPTAESQSIKEIELKPSNNRVRILGLAEERSGELLIRTRLEREGFDVFTATDSKKALELFDAKNPDVLVTELRVPGDLDGIGLAMTMQASKPDMPVILIWTTDIDRGREEIQKIYNVALVERGNHRALIAAVIGASGYLKQKE